MNKLSKFIQKPIFIGGVIDIFGIKYFHLPSRDSLQQKKEIALLKTKTAYRS